MLPVWGKPGIGTASPFTSTIGAADATPAGAIAAPVRHEAPTASHLITVCVFIRPSEKSLLVAAWAAFAGRGVRAA